MPSIELIFDQIAFDPKVQIFCCNPKFLCPNYGHSWACPPEAPYLENRVSEFKKFYLIYVKFDLDNYIEQIKKKHPNRKREKIIKSFYRKDLIRDELETEIFTFLNQSQQNYSEKLILWDGFCRICYKENKGCTYDKNELCRHPDKIRYSMEAVGINVDKTVKNINIDLEWPPMHYAYRFGLVCFK